MSLPDVVVCRGAPRDLGLDQGRACTEAIRDRVRRAGGRGDWLGRWRPFDGRLGRARRTARDLRRHFPHLDEHAIGLARGAGVPELALAHLLARELDAAEEGLALQAGLDGEGRLVVAVPRGGALRRLEPEHGFGSVEWTRPWLPGALAGVNRAGLAGAVVAGRAGDPGPCQAPAFLLLQNCLAQFETVEAAAEWCERRPAGGRADLVFRDARGGGAAVSVEGEKRARVEPARAPASAAAVTIVLDPSGPVLVASEEGAAQRLAP